MILSFQHFKVFQFPLINAIKIAIYKNMMPKNAINHEYECQENVKGPGSYFLCTVFAFGPVC